MLTLALISVALLTIAVIWSAILWRNLRNWRVGILTAFIGIILIRRIQVTTHTLGWSEPMPLLATEWIAVLIAALALLTVGAWHLYVIGRGRAMRQVEFLASALSASADAVLIVESTQLPDGFRIHFVNDAFCRMTGYTASELVGRPSSVFIGPDTDMKIISDSVAEVTAGHSSVIEVISYAKGGRPYWVELSVAPIRDQRGRTTHYFIHQRDITDRKRIDDQLRVADLRYRSIIRATGTGFSEVSPQGIILDANDEFVRLTGRSDLSQVIGRSVLEWTAPHDLERNKREVAKCATQGYVRGLEIDYISPDGRITPVEISAVTIQELGDPRIIAFCRDISARRKADAELRASEQRLASMVRHTPLAVILWDSNFRIAEWNPAAESIFGWSAREAFGRHAHFIVPPEAHKYVDDIWRGLSTNKGGARGTNENLTKDNRIISCEWYNSPLFDADGRLQGVVSLCQDVTERVRAEHKQHILMLELDHRVKNNLAAILALAEQTLHTSSTLEQFGESFTGRLRAMSRMHELLARSRWQDVNLHDMIRRSLEAYVIGPVPPITLEGQAVLLPSKLATGLSLVLHELATNAAKYGSLSIPTGHVHVRWSVEQTGSEDRVPSLSLHWSESGGPPVISPTRRGFGTGLIEGIIAYEFAGNVRFDFDRTGLCCRIVLPLPTTIESAETPPAEHSASS